MTEQAKETLEALFSDSTGEEYPYTDKFGQAVHAAIQALEELEQYRALGTVEELKEAREKQVAKKPIHDDGVWSICPCCGEKVANDSYEAVNGELSYCEKCGQAIDWSEEDD